jgi:hypothetical protein
MSRGARPGERRGGRKKGTPNKLTVGKLGRQRQSYTLDSTLTDLSKLLVVFVPDPEYRHLLCHAIDRYVAARGRASSREKQHRSVVKDVPPDPSMQLTTDFRSLQLNWPPDISLESGPELPE